MDLINSILTAAELEQARDAYHRNREKLMQRMREELPRWYRPAGAYISAVETIFYEDPQPNTLSAKNRERVIVALLAVRDADFNLALHMYLALMEGVEPGEIAHILMLAGVYGGVESFADGIRIEATLLKFLKEQGATLEGDKLLEALARVIRF